MAELYPSKALMPKWKLAYFWPNIGNFGHNFTHKHIWTFFPSFRSILMGKPILRPNGPILAILSPKNFQTLKLLYFRMQFSLIAITESLITLAKFLAKNWPKNWRPKSKIRMCCFLRNLPL